MTDAVKKERLMKLLALADRGVGGEAVNAHAALEAALAKHGLNLDDLTGGEKEMRMFPFRGPVERRLLRQIIATVCGVKTELFVPRNKATSLMAKMTKEEMVEVEILWTAHRAQFKKEQDLFVSAYIHRQRLFPSDANDEDERELTPDERERIERMAQMMMGIKTVIVRKQLVAR